jgi:hypothetical protein
MFAVTRLLLLVAVLINGPEVLVLTSGARISVEGDVSLQNGSYVFRSNGTLYALPADEVDVPATNRREEARRAELERSRPSGPVKMKVSADERQKIFEKLNNTAKDAGTPATMPPVVVTAPSTEVAVAAEVEPSREELRQEERYWREESRRHHEAVERWREELAFLARREQKLEDEILMLMSLGYKSRQFSMEVMQLERAREAQERARLELGRAERALQQFLADARREGILPGWLR